MEKGVGGETGNDGRREKILFMIAGKINTSLSCYIILRIFTYFLGGFFT